MNDAEAFALIDAHLDRQPLTDEQSDALTAWIKASPQRADEAFSRIFLHSYLRVRLQAGLPETTTDLALLADPASPEFDDPKLARISGFGRVPALRNRWRDLIFLTATGLLIAAAISLLMWRSFSGMLALGTVPSPLFAYEGFDYPATLLPGVKGDFTWPTSGGLEGLAGGTGWHRPWQETNSKVAIIVDYSRRDPPFEVNDMRKFGPLGYSDSHGNVLKTSGNQMRTATSPRSISDRQIDIHAFPESMRDGGELGADGSLVWFSFLAQSSVTSAEHNRYSYLVIGQKEVSGFRIGKLGAAPSGNWTAVGLLTGAEVNLRSSSIPSGEMVFLATRIRFRPGPEEAAVWINPQLDSEPADEDASLRLQVPDFRFDSVAIHANHSADFDEIRFGGSFQSVAPIRPSRL